MRLTVVLGVIWKATKRTPGLITTGKHQKKVTIRPEWRMTALKWMAMEKRNLDLLDRPYVTKEEERSYLADTKYYMTKAAENRAKYAEEKKKKMYKHYTSSEHLEHLNVSKKWE